MKKQMALALAVAVMAPCYGSDGTAAPKDAMLAEGSVATIDISRLIDNLMVTLPNEFKSAGYGIMVGALMRSEQAGEFFAELCQRHTQAMKDDSRLDRYQSIFEFIGQVAGSRTFL